jgi:hypothetical protein
MLGAEIGRGAMKIIDAMTRGLASLGIPPNVLTTTGVVINMACGVLFGLGNFFGAGFVLIVANLFDMLDGNVARMSGRVTKYGTFLDSTLDRLSDMVAFFGIMIFYARATPQHSVVNRSASCCSSSVPFLPGIGNRKIGSRTACRRFCGCWPSARSGRSCNG